MDLVAALEARGYSSEVIRVGTGLESQEGRATTGQELRCGLDGFLFVQSSSMMPNGFCCVRGSGRSGFVDEVAGYT